MLQPTERREEIVQYLQEIIETRFCESCQLIQRQVEQHGKQIWEELCSTIVKVLQASAGSTASYLAFSFLDSSVYTDRLEFHVDVFDEGFYVVRIEGGKNKSDGLDDLKTNSGLVIYRDEVMD